MKIKREKVVKIKVEGDPFLDRRGKLLPCQIQRIKTLRAHRFSFIQIAEIFPTCTIRVLIKQSNNKKEKRIKQSEKRNLTSYKSYWEVGGKHTKTKT